MTIVFAPAFFHVNAMMLNTIIIMEYSKLTAISISPDYFI